MQYEYDKYVSQSVRLENRAEPILLWSKNIFSGKIGHILIKNYYHI